MGTYTTNYQLYTPTVGETGWGTLVNGNFTTIDNTMKSLNNRITAVENEVNGALSCTSVTASGKITGNGGIAGTTGTFSGNVTAASFNSITITEDRFGGTIVGYMLHLYDNNDNTTLGTNSLPVYQYATSGVYTILGNENQTYRNCGIALLIPPCFKTGNYVYPLKGAFATPTSGYNLTLQFKSASTYKGRTITYSGGISKSATLNSNGEASISITISELNNMITKPTYVKVSGSDSIYAATYVYYMRNTGSTGISVEI